MSLFIVGLDNTIVNVGLPSIERDLHASVSGLAWVVDAYTVVLASLLMLSGSTADRLGRRRTFQVGLALFTLGSLLCSLAPGLGWLIAFRMVQAVGGSMLNPVAMSIIANTFTDPGERARAVGIWGAVMGISMALGPVFGGMLVATVGWRGIFWVNIPVGLAGILLTGLFVPESRADRPRRTDPVGQGIVIVMLASLTYAIIEGPRAGWGSVEITGLFAVSALSMAALVGYERRRQDPLLDLRYFRSVPLSGAVVLAISAFASLGGFLFLSTIYLQDVRGMSALDAGLFMMPMAVMTVVLAPPTGAVIARWGPRGPLLIAGIGLTAGGVMMTVLTPVTSLPWLLGAFFLMGVGFGTVNAPITNTAVSGMPLGQAGVAAGVASTSRQVGQTMGVAVVGSAVASALAGPLRDGFTQASHLGWWVIAGCGAVVLIGGQATSGRWAGRSGARAAAALAAEDANTPVPAGS